MLYPEYDSASGEKFQANVIWLCCPGSDSRDPPFGRCIRMEM